MQNKAQSCRCSTKGSRGVDSRNEAEASSVISGAILGAGVVAAAPAVIGYVAGIGAAGPIAGGAFAAVQAAGAGGMVVAGGIAATAQAVAMTGASFLSVAIGAVFGALIGF